MSEHNCYGAFITADSDGNRDAAVNHPDVVKDTNGYKYRIEREDIKKLVILNAAWDSYQAGAGRCPTGRPSYGHGFYLTSLTAVRLVLRTLNSEPMRLRGLGAKRERLP